ncbi:hypothetical protein DH09_08450 [Bacillaceae bacterium JMAK1]|nr:hypothetical protein DH09_08450 [Bacillaceae bacterium JMAK1]
MNNEQYLKERLEDQISWYDNKSIKSQKRYKSIKGFEIIVAALIPVVAIFELTWIAGLMGASIAVLEGILNINKYHENWIEYRSICETLKHEKYMFSTLTGVYRYLEEDDAFMLLVERVENIISKENVNWANMNREKKEG